MRTAWLALGLAVVPAGALILTMRRRPASASPKPAAPSPSAAPELTPALEAALKQWLDVLDVDNLGQPTHRVPSAEALGGASVFANELQAAGYPVEAEALRTAIALASTSQPIATGAP